MVSISLKTFGYASKMFNVCNCFTDKMSEPDRTSNNITERKRRNPLKEYSINIDFLNKVSVLNIFLNNV